MALGDVYQLVVNQSLQSQKVVNVFYYEQSTPFVNNSGTTNAGVLGISFRANVIPTWRSYAVTQLAFESIEVENLFDDTDTWVDILALNGQRAAPSGSTPEILPAFTSLGITLDGAGKQVRDGKKRLAGLWEGDSVSGFAATGLVAACQPLLTRFAEGRDYGSPTLAEGFRPIVVSRVQEVINGQRKYRLPRTRAELVFKAVTEAALSLILTTQNTRKLGRGS